MIGTVLCFRPQRGYGTLRGDGQPTGCFFTTNVVRDLSPSDLRPGLRVAFSSSAHADGFVRATVVEPVTAEART